MSVDRTAVMDVRGKVVEVGDRARSCRQATTTTSRRVTRSLSSLGPQAGTCALVLALAAVEDRLEHRAISLLTKQARCYGDASGI